MLRLVQPIRSFLVGRGSISDVGDRYPVLDKTNMSSVPGLCVIGNIAGTPDIRAALNSGSDIGRHLERELATPGEALDADYDVVIVGAGPAGIACGAVLRRASLRLQILECTRTLATIRAFKPDLVLYDAVTGDPANRSTFPYEDTTAGELLALWKPLLEKLQLPIREKISIANVTKRLDVFEVELAGGEMVTARRVVLSVGKLIQLEKLGAA